MAPDQHERVVDLRRLRRSCRECSLRTLCLPAGIPPADMEQLDRVVQSRLPLDRGQSLFRAGDRLEHLYAARSGTLRTAQPGSEGDEQVIGFHLPGELAGLEAISDDTHHCDAVALERTSVCAVPFGRLQEVAARVPALQSQFHRLISRELVQDQQHLIALGRRTARERLALFLHSLAQRLEASGLDGCELRLVMSRDDIANYLGLALETVSRLLTKLTEEGVIDVERRRVRIVDPVALARVAGQPVIAGGTGERDREHGS
ncbi:MAG: helix-turn-helix domain-containing protein [Halofilum sp. (in: g-proteobacteria)]|nr:helix-turn-helix domain-containing protein [Halofilum sp. (in: g-proteobacteria)]